MCGFAPIFLVHIVLPSHKCNFSAIQTSGHRIIKPIISSRFIFSSYNPSISQASSNANEPHNFRNGIGNVGILASLGSSYASGLAYRNLLNLRSSWIASTFQSPRAFLTRSFANSICCSSALLSASDIIVSFLWLCSLIEAITNGQVRTFPGDYNRL